MENCFFLCEQAEQTDNPSQSVDVILHVNVYEINLYPATFSNPSYTMLGYTTYTNNLVPTVNGSVIDNDIVKTTSKFDCLDNSLHFVFI